MFLLRKKPGRTTYGLVAPICLLFQVLPDYDIGCPIPETPESVVEGVNFFVITLRGSRILSKAYQMLFSVSATTNTKEQYYAAIDFIKLDAERWKNSIPSKFRPGTQFQSTNSSSTFLILRVHYVYHILIISLCRLELHVGGDENSQRLADTRKLLMNTARTIIQLFNLIDLKPYTPLWLV